MSTQNNESKTSNLATIPSGFATAGKKTQKEIEKQVVEQGVENWKASYAKPAPKMSKGRKIAIAIILSIVVIIFALMLLIAGGAFGV